MVLVRRIADYSPNLPNFLPAKHSHYTVCTLTKLFVSVCSCTRLHSKNLLLLHVIADFRVKTSRRLWRGVLWCLLVCGGYAVLRHDFHSDMSRPTSHLMHRGWSWVVVQWLKIFEQCETKEKKVKCESNSDCMRSKSLPCKFNTKSCHWHFN